MSEVFKVKNHLYASIAYLVLAMIMIILLIK